MHILYFKILNHPQPNKNRQYLTSIPPMPVSKIWTVVKTLFIHAFIYHSFNSASIRYQVYTIVHLSRIVMYRWTTAKSSVHDNNYCEHLSIAAFLVFTRNSQDLCHCSNAHKFFISSRKLTYLMNKICKKIKHTTVWVKKEFTISFIYNVYYFGELLSR